MVVFKSFGKSAVFFFRKKEAKKGGLPKKLRGTNSKILPSASLH
jgi:hypothetical protein